MPTDSPRAHGAVLSVRLPKETVIALDEEAMARGVPMSEIVREALDRRHVLTGGSLAVTLAALPSEAETGPSRADVEWLIRFARKSKGTVTEIAQRALDQNPGLRPGGWGLPSEAETRLREAAQAVIASWDDRWLDCSGMAQPVEALRAALRVPDIGETYPLPQPPTDFLPGGDGWPRDLDPLTGKPTKR